jgi:hypothetical protein
MLKDLWNRPDLLFRFNLFLDGPIPIVIGSTLLACFVTISIYAGIYYLEYATSWEPEECVASCASMQMVLAEPIEPGDCKCQYPK